MSAADLLASMMVAWPKVGIVPGWETRGGAWTHGKPIGVMEHHTALPVPFPVDRLYGSLLKCNINTKPDGTVWMVAYEACNYSSGLGSSVVLGQVLSETAPTANARERDLVDDRNGNPLFFNFENDHPGNGSDIPDIQHEAIVVSTRVVNEHFDLVPAQTISHAEWTWRKRDPYWNGDLRAIETIRSELAKGDDMTPAQEEKLDRVLAILDDLPVDTWAAYPGVAQDKGGSSAYQTLLRSLAASVTTQAIVTELAKTGRTLSEADIVVIKNAVAAEHAESFGLIQRDDD